MSKITRKVKIKFIFHVDDYTVLNEVLTYGFKRDVAYVLNLIQSRGVDTMVGRVAYSPLEFWQKIFYTIGESVHEVRNKIHTVTLNFVCAQGIYRKLVFE